MRQLKDIIKLIESSNNPQAVRFEPLFYEKLKEKNIQDRAIEEIRKIHKCTYYTALMIASTSWGLFQIMGYNLYFYDLTDKTVFEFLFDEEEQERAFEKFTQIKNINFTVEQLKTDIEKVKRFARLYNGDVENYSRKILKLLERENVIDV
ncbi:N-acetylmuramidase domain-containing protein [Persephonella sp.]